MKRTRFKHREYSKGFKFYSAPDKGKWDTTTTFDQLFRARLPMLDEVVFGVPYPQEDTEILKLLEKKFIREWKRQLMNARKTMGRRPFNQALAAWLSSDGTQVKGGKRRRETKRNAARRGDLTE